MKVARTFNESIEHNKLNDLFGDAKYVSELYSYLKRNNIHERKDRLKVFKMWFLSGRDIHVNGSARGRVMLKYSPELRHLLKIGFIKSTRSRQYNFRIVSDTILILNKD